MYVLRLTCEATDIDALSGQLWEAGTIGVQETDDELIATFETNDRRADLLHQFAEHAPKWEQQPAIDWVQETYRAWPGRAVGKRFFLAPLWCQEATPPGRIRITHNPGAACGTGEHPCTQLALEAVERHVQPLSRLVDIGTGSGLLAIAALQLSAALAVGIDTDEAALQSARENFELNNLPATLAAGSADCLANYCADVVVANISATVLLSIADELPRLATENGWLILTGFPESELATVQDVFSAGEVTGINEWRCLCVQGLAPAFDRHAERAQTNRPPAGSAP